jgi:hypothetical protein
MNVALKVDRRPEVLTVEHSVMAYDRSTDELVGDWPVPLCLDSLALKIAGVPEDDVRGAVSYPLNKQQTDVFGLLLGVEPPQANREYFLESTHGLDPAFGPAKIGALEILSGVVVGPKATRGSLTQGELVVPTLCVLDACEPASIQSPELARRLVALLKGIGSSSPKGPTEPPRQFAEKIIALVTDVPLRNLLVLRGLASFDPPDCKLNISPEGHTVIQALRG